jgi:AbrB family looped-hinge helix DNA binding protein
MYLDTLYSRSRSMKTIRAHLSSKSQVTIPADVRAKLKVQAHDPVDFVIDGNTVTLRRAPYTVEDLKGIVPALDRPVSDDFDQEIDEAMEDMVDEFFSESNRP